MLLGEGGEQILPELWRCVCLLRVLRVSAQIFRDHSLTPQTRRAISASERVRERGPTRTGVHEPVLGKLVDMIIELLATHLSPRSGRTIPAECPQFVGEHRARAIE